MGHKFYKFIKISMKFLRISSFDFLINFHWIWWEGSVGVSPYGKKKKHYITNDWILGSPCPISLL
jgi:hypothetical protein